MLDQVKIVDMSEKRKPGGPVVAIGPETIHPVDLIDRARPTEDNRGNHFPWRWVLALSLILVALVWIASAI